MSLQRCSDTSELVELCERYNLYLKPLRQIKICVQLPALKVPGQSISSWQVMENLKKMVKPDEFDTLKVAKSNLVLMQFEAEVEKKITVNRVLQKLQSNSMKLSGFTDVLKIRAATAKLNFPTRHDWDSFFRDPKNDEANPGERPDTIYFQNLPTKWFSDKSSASGNPSEYVLKKVFETFGDVRALEIPSVHKSCSKNEAFKKMSTFNQENVFDAYVQYKEYMGFVKAMDSLKGMKLVFVNKDGEAHSAGIKVDFDKTKYLTDRSIHFRAYERLKADGLVVKPSLPEKKENVAKPKKQCLAEPSSSLTKKSSKSPELKKSIIHKAKLLRQKESTFLLKELLRKAKIVESEKQAKLREEQIAQEKIQQQKLKERMLEEEKRLKEEKERIRKKLLDEQERLLRRKLLRNLKDQEQRRTEQLREKLRKEIAGRNVLKSVLVATHKVKTKKSNHRTKRLYSDMDNSY